MKNSDKNNAVIEALVEVRAEIRDCEHGISERNRACAIITKKINSLKV